MIHSFYIQIWISFILQHDVNISFGYLINKYNIDFTPTYQIWTLILKIILYNLEFTQI